MIGAAWLVAAEIEGADRALVPKAGSVSRRCSTVRT